MHAQSTFLDVGVLIWRIGLLQIVITTQILEALPQEFIMGLNSSHNVIVIKFAIAHSNQVG